MGRHGSLHIAYTSACRSLKADLNSSPVNIRQNTGEDPLDKSTWAVRLCLALLPYALCDLGRFIHRHEDDQQLMHDIWVIAQEIQEQTNELKKYLPRAAVWN